MVVRLKLFIALFLLLVTSISCDKQIKTTVNNPSFLPRASGENNEMLLIMDSTKFQGKIGRLLVDTYGSYLPGLPQPEPRFDLRYIKPRKFNNILRHAKNIVVAFTLEGNSFDSQILRKNFNQESLESIEEDSTLFYFTRRDQYAKGQIILYLFSKSDEDLYNKLAKNKKAILTYFENELQKRISDKVFAREEKNISQKILSDHDVKLKIPIGYDLAKNIKGDISNFFWLRQLDPEFEKNIFLYYEDYLDSNPSNFYDVFSSDKPDIYNIRNYISRKFLKDSENSNIFMSIQDIFPIESSRFNYNNNLAVESIGLWKLSDISAGGPFKSIIIYDKNKNRIYYLEGYVYAPGLKKRELMQEISSILMTFES